MILSRQESFGNIFSFIADLNSIKDGSEFETNYCSIYPKQLELNKEEIHKHKASFWI